MSGTGPFGWMLKLFSVQLGKCYFRQNLPTKYSSILFFAHKLLSNDAPGTGFGSWFF